MKKLSALILAFIILAASFASCSDNKSNENESSSGEASSGESTSGDDETGNATTYFNDKEPVDMGGWEINFCGGEGDAELALTGTARHIWVDSITGDEFNDALYNRVIAVNEKYNVTLNFLEGDADTDIKRSVTAGTKDYQVGSQIFETLSSLINGGYTRPVTDCATIDFEMPWWDRGACETLTFNDKMHFIFADLSYDHYDSACVLFYNGVILGNNQITETPYDLWKEGKWTYDAMYAMTEKVTADTNGDGKMVEGDDVYGLVGRSLRYMVQPCASGVNIIEYSDEKGFTLNMTDETVIAVGDWCRKLCIDSPYAVMGTDTSMNTFKNGYALFDSQYLGDFRVFRDQEDDYGIVTWPTLYENMEGSVYVRNPVAQVIAADVSDDDIDNLGIIIDAMGAYSYDYIIENYINRAVIGKGARDQQSAEVIRDLMDRRFYDVTYSMDIDIVVDAWQKAIKGNSYSSMEQKVKKSFERALEAALAPYED